MMVDFWVEKFRKEALLIISREFKAEKVIVFGSRIRGTAKEESDIDVILISSFFKDIPFLKRMPLVLKKVPFTKHIDYLCYTPEEYESIKEESILIIDALENCIELSV